MVDSLIVIGYFLIIFIAGYFVSRHYRSAGDEEFITGGRSRNWYQIALALFAMGADPFGNGSRRSRLSLGILPDPVARSSHVVHHLVRGHVPHSHLLAVADHHNSLSILKNGSTCRAAPFSP